MNLLGTQIHPPCLEPETWLMKNKRGVIQDFIVPTNSLKKKHECGKTLRKQTWTILPNATSKLFFSSMQQQPHFFIPMFLHISFINSLIH